MRLIGAGARQTITDVAHTLVESGEKYDVGIIREAIVMPYGGAAIPSGYKLQVTSDGHIDGRFPNAQLSPSINRAPVVRLRSVP